MPPSNPDPNTDQARNLARAILLADTVSPVPASAHDALVALREELARCQGIPVGELCRMAETPETLRRTSASDATWRLTQLVQAYALGRENDVARRGKTARLAGLMVQVYGRGLVAAAQELLDRRGDTAQVAYAVDEATARIDPQWREHDQELLAGRPAELVSYAVAVDAGFIEALEPKLMAACDAEGLEYNRDDAGPDWISLTFFDTEEEQVDRLIRRVRAEVAAGAPECWTGRYSAADRLGLHVYKSFIISHHYWSLSFGQSRNGYRFTEDTQP